MFKQALICATILGTITVASVIARQEVTSSANTSLPQKLQVPGTGYEFVVGSATFIPEKNHSAYVLLTALTYWTAEKTGLPANYEFPKLEFVSAIKMAEVRYKSLLGEKVASTGGGSNTAQRENMALYDNATKTIYLREGWTGRSPAELSILIHELVHHLQNLGQVKHECPQQRERLAYRVQNQWLWLFDSDLSKDFDIDPFTLLVTTSCSY